MSLGTSKNVIPQPGKRVTPGLFVYAAGGADIGVDVAYSTRRFADRNDLLFCSTAALKAGQGNLAGNPGLLVFFGT
jgi:hypothetical protein